MEKTQDIAYLAVPAVAVAAVAHVGQHLRAEAVEAAAPRVGPVEGHDAQDDQCQLQHVTKLRSCCALS